jgi:hypothetical protein
MGQCQRAYCEEHGLDTIFRMVDPAEKTAVYLLKDWRSAQPEKVTKWEGTLTSGVGDHKVCDYDIDNLKWSGKAVMNSIALDLWESIEKDVGGSANGPIAYAAVIMKIQQVSASAIHSLVKDIKDMSLIKEPGQDVNVIGSKVIKMAHQIKGSGSAPTYLSSIMAGCFIECDVLAFKLKAPTFHDLVDSNPNFMPWEDIVRQLKAKYTSLYGSDL